MSDYDEILHPGIRIKNEVIPQGMSVTQAAKVMGVGRPALSNLLNGNAALSAEMATRLEKAFGFPRNALLEMQANYDVAQAKDKNAPADTRAYVPPFLGIRANQIEQWVTNNIFSRSRFSVLLRTLVHSTGRALTKVDFPGNDDAECPGWDGFVEAGEGTSWIPAGLSGWEFGVNADIAKKANKDFNKSIKAIAAEDRRNTTFVFVTPRRWPGKTAWIKVVRAKGDWKDVRAYDASDLEQWLEQSLPAQTWFANETEIPAQHVRSLDKSWRDWANVSVPPLTGALFGSGMETARRKMVSRLSNLPDTPTVIAADSTEEALAFLAQLFTENAGEELASHRDRLLVFDKPGVLPRLAQGAPSFIPVVHTREVERELGPHTTVMHSIVIYPRNAVSAEPDIVLEPANYETFSKALSEMGKDRDEITRLENESGRSLTVLRRRLATVDAVRKPIWAEDAKVAASLVPFLLVGRWRADNDTDTTALSLLAGDCPYPDLEKEFQRLIQLNDAPIWSIGANRGVVSKIDLLYAIANTITPDDLKRFFSLAIMVLGEDDPALDLKEDQRWAASLYKKTRKFSGPFRQGVSETLVLLAVHGAQLFRKRLAVDTETEARLVVRELLGECPTVRILEANNHDLPTYAEAAPDEFLSILERDLKTNKPAVLGLLRPVDASIFGTSPSRTGLLWALESLSWNPETLPRAARILAQLAQVEINDNWANKPIHSLEAIFRAWMPQTAASHMERIVLIKRLAERFPDIVWNICVEQFNSRNDIGHYSHKPRWRSDGYGAGEPISDWAQIDAFRREMLEMALGWKNHTLEMLSDLVMRLPSLDESYQARVWTLVGAWAKKATDAEKSSMREKIRITTLSRRAAIRGKKNPRMTAVTRKAKAVYAALEPSDLLNRHAWLFREPWIEESADEIEDIDSIDYGKRDERIQKMRISAMRDIKDQLGLAGLLTLAERGKTSWQIGVHAAKDLLSEEELQNFLQLAFQSVLKNNDDVQPFKALITGALCAFQDDERRDRILKAVAADLPKENLPHFFMLAPFCRSTWKLVDALDEAIQAKYWAGVIPDWMRASDEENSEAVERLLKAERPRAAFACIRLKPEELDEQILFHLLSEIAKGGKDRPDEYRLDRHSLVQAFKHLNNSPLLTTEQKAGLEFAFIEVLGERRHRNPNSYGIPNLERYIENHPEFLVQAIVWSYKRRHGGHDPAEFQIPPDRRDIMAERGHKLLDALNRIPGHDDLGDLKADRLIKWITTIRQACESLDRAKVADHCIGELLSRAPVGSDGIWPCEPVRQAMEDIESEHIMRGAHTGIFNARGAHWRGEGGDQERTLAEKYRKWAQAIRPSYPYVSSMLLMELAKTYERDANREDLEAGIRRRLR